MTIALQVRVSLLTIHLKWLTFLWDCSIVERSKTRKESKNMMDFLPDGPEDELPMEGETFDLSKDSLFQVAKRTINLERLEVELELEAKRGVNLMTPANVPLPPGLTMEAFRKKGAELLAHAMKIGITIFLETQITGMIKAGFAAGQPEFAERVQKIISHRQAQRRA